MLSQFLDSWASIYANHPALRTGILFMHIGGLLAAGGSAITVDLATIKVRRETPDARAAHLDVLKRTHGLVVTGLAAIVFSGLLQLGADVGTFAASKIFWLKMALVVLLLVNGVLILGGERQVQRDAPGAWARLHATAAASLLLWFVITLAGVALTNIG
jgi:cytochrome b subunit of formate dehydrogenase